jgi:hypothetical protein
MRFVAIKSADAQCVLITDRRDSRALQRRILLTLRMTDPAFPKWQSPSPSRLTFHHLLEDSQQLRVVEGRKGA